MHRVLVVEDDPDLRWMFRTALTFAGYEVVQANDGLEALRQLEAGGLDCVVLDLGLPLVSGHVVLQEVAAQAQTSDVPVVVVVTGNPVSEDALPQAACVLAKPVTPERLVDTVRRCMAAPSSTERA